MSTLAATNLKHESSASNNIVLTSGGDVGIGTSSPAGKLDILTGTYRGYFDDAAGSLFRLNGVNAANSAYGPMGLNGSIVLFQTGASERMRIDSSGNIGIGTSSPVGKFASVGGAIQLSGGTTAQEGIRIQRASGYAGIYGINNDNNAYNAIAIFTGVSEAMRIDSSGNFFVGKSSAASDVTTVGAFIQNNGKGVFTTTGVVQPLVVAKNANTAGAMIEFYYNGSVVGSITTNGTGVTYGTASDYRLKNSVAPLGSGLNLISALRPVTYKWNVDDSYGEGFIAHELQSVIPAAVSGEKDAINKDGSINPQGVDYSKIVVHLVAAIQELKADFDAYKAAHP